MSKMIIFSLKLVEFVMIFAAALKTADSFAAISAVDKVRGETGSEVSRPA